VAKVRFDASCSIRPIFSILSFILFYLILFLFLFCILILFYLFIRPIFSILFPSFVFTPSRTSFFDFVI